MRLVLTESQILEIQELHRKCSTKRYADRLKALLLLNKGFSCVEVGEILLLDDDTVRKHRNQYLVQGAKSLLSDKNNGTKPMLNTDQLDKLDKHLSKNIYSDSKEINNWIA